MNTKTDSIWAAAEHLLRRDAEELRESSTSPRDRDDWTGEEEAKADYDEHIAAADALASLSTVAAALPPSYLGGSLVANVTTGECLVRMHFGNAKEAERWFDAATDSREAAPKAAPPVGSDAALNTLAQMFHSAEEIEGPDGLAMMVDMSMWNSAVDAFDEISGDSMEPTAPKAEPVIDVRNRSLPTTKAALQPAVQQGEPLAWMDDGTLRAGSEATAYRVVTDVTKRGMTASLAASFITPLYAHPAAPAAQGDALDAERYRLLRRGQRWSVIDGIGDTLRGDELDAAIDAARAAKEGGA